jgi:hypothetical protein
LRLRKRQGWTVVHERNTGRPGELGRVLITNSNNGEVREVAAGEVAYVVADLELTPLELGWEIVP